MERMQILAAACALVVCASFGDPEAKPSNVRGTVVGPDSAPLPEYTLELRVERPDPASSGAPRLRVERVTTNERGEFESALQYLPGPVRFRRIDTDATVLIPSRGDLEALALRGSPRVLERAHEGKPLRLSVDSGPTFELLWKPRQAPEGERNPPAVAGSIARLICRTPGDADEGACYTTSLRVLGEDHAWVRFAGVPILSELELTGAGSDKSPDTRRLILEIVTVDGIWKATSDVTDLVRAKGRKVELAWSACARWTGAVGGSRIVPSERIWFTAERLDDKDEIVERRRRRVEPGGAVVFRGLDPGRWRFASSALRFDPWKSSTRELAAGKTVTAEIALVPIENGVTFACQANGDPVVEGGRPQRSGRAWISRPGSIVPLDERGLVWTQHEGRWVAPIEFTGVPAGEYAVTVLPRLDDDDYGANLASIRSTTDGALVGVPWRRPD